MTVSSTNTKRQFNGDGSTAAFAYNFKVFADADLQVIVRSATGTESVKTSGSHYNASGIGETSGGTVTFTSGNIPASGETITLRRAKTVAQELDLVANDPFPAANLENQLDKLTHLILQNNEELDRALKLSRTNTMTSTEFTNSATDRANKLLSFDGSGELSVAQELGSFKGDWGASTAYVVRDLVKDTSTNNVFICITAHTSSGSQPLTTNTDSAKWSLIVQNLITTQTDITSILNTSLVVGRDADNDIDFGTDNTIILRAAAADQIKLVDGAIAPVTDNDVDLGTTSLEFKDMFIDGTAHIDTLDVDVNAAVGGNATVAGTLGVTGAVTGSSTVQGTVITATTGFAPDASDGAYLGTSSLQFSDLFLADGAIIKLGDDQDVTLTHVADVGVLLNSTSQLQFGDSGTYIHQSADGVLDLVSDTEIEINATTIDINGAADISGNLAVGGTLGVTGATTLAATSFGDANITNVGNIALDSISADGTDIAVAVSDNSATALTIKQGSNPYLIIDTGDGDESVAIGTGVNGTAISIGHTTSETTINDNLTVTGDLTVNGSTTTVDTANLAVKDSLVGLNTGASTGNDAGIIIERGSTGNDALIMWDESEDKWTLGTTTATASSTGNLNITAGTLVANLEGNVTGTASTATVATTVTITDNESTNEDNAVVFTAGGDVDGGNIGLESDGNLTYNPSTGKLSSTLVSGGIQTALIEFTDGTDAITVASGGGITANVSLTLASGSTVTAVLDEDNFASDSATALATQQSIKAYVGTIAGQSNNIVGLTASADELNILDCSETTPATVTVVDGDGLVFSDGGNGGTLKQITVQSLAAYLDDEITAMPNLVTTAATTVGALDAGSITSGFGTINTGASAITTTGAITGGSFVIGSADINENDLESIDGITAGTVAASKAAVVDANKDITGFRNVTLTGELDAATLDISGNADIDGDLTVSSAAVKVAGKETIWIPAAAMYPSTTNGCSALTQVETTAGRPDLKCLDFATGADDFAQFSIAFPKSWNEGTITFQPFWTVTGTNTGTVAWGLAGVASSNDDTINIAFGTVVVTTAKAHSGTSNDLMVSNASGAVTIAGSPAADDLCFFQVSRDVSADDQSGDARLLGIKLFFTTNAANDA